MSRELFNYFLALLIHLDYTRLEFKLLTCTDVLFCIIGQMYVIIDYRKLRYTIYNYRHYIYEIFYDKLLIGILKTRSIRYCIIRRVIIIIAKIKTVDE